MAGRAAQGLLIGLVPALLLGCARAPDGPTVRSGNARFEFLTPALVRLEYSPSGAFVDAPSAVVQRRTWPAVKVSTRESDGWLIARTQALTVRYRQGSGAFSAENLEVNWTDPEGGHHQWHPGDVDHHNLGGLTYSLDNLSKANLPEGLPDIASPTNDTIPGIDVLLGKAQPGLLSRSGYALIDDSHTPVWNAQQTWIEPRREQHGQDWYFFAYNRDYHQVLEEYARLCGPVPMVPRYVLGAWITDLNFEYFPGTLETERPEFKRYNQQYLEQEVARMRSSHIPFDSLVLDFAWHNYGWQGGYDWSPLVPQPDEFTRWLRGEGVKLSLNDHPGYANTPESILSYSDSHAPQVLKDLGRALPPKPTVDLDLTKDWSFATDPHDEGLKARWYAPKSSGGHWQRIRIGAWEDQGFGNYRGIGWYRTTVSLPAKLPAALYLYLGEVRDQYQVFVNGKEATHTLAHWPERLTYADIAPLVTAGRRNEIVLRVKPELDPEELGGILRGPVAIGDVVPPPRIYFDLSNQQQAEVSMRDLHQPLMQQGLKVWWVDGGSGAVDMPGLNKQMWTNKVFYDFSERFTHQRAFILARYGDWGSERYPGYFTGDTYSEWPVLAYEVAFTARGGNVLIPYISHDIGGFHGARIAFDLYARWLEFGAFSPILRMHSAHENPREGNVRMPWTYGNQGIELMRRYFTLRSQLIPYLYTYTWLAHRDSTPLLRPLYLEYPDLEEAYRHSHEYFFGAEVLVAPVLDPSGDVTIYLPPGRWLDFFTGKSFAGDRSFTAHYAVDEIPVFVRDGAVIPEQAVSDYSDAKPFDPVIINVYGTQNGRFDLYEDDGSSLAYRAGEQAQTSITHTAGADGVQHLLVGPTQGFFQGQLPARAYELRLHTRLKPASVSVNGKPVETWTWDAVQATATVPVPRQSIREKISAEWR